MVMQAMGSEHLDELIALDDAYWWHVAKRELVARLLARHCPPPGRVVEGGFGSGRNLREFRRLGYAVQGLDAMPQAVDHARRIGFDEVWQHDLTQPWPLEPESTRAVVLLDVLEHLADPVAALGHAARVLEPGGGVIVTVPANPRLYGPWDEQLGHHRRYTSRLLRSQALEASLRVERVTHWNSFSLPAAAVVRTLERWRPRREGTEFPRVPGWVNRTLVGCARMERWWLERFAVPAGLSLVGVLRK
ncbi:MAG TPA: class I SAM-dependent methyltransferase [Planctomycetaceae bacterium]|nr:class I SAM-dependent methyltransferase [Planctomycetaceae bacterium]